MTGGLFGLALSTSTARSQTASQIVPPSFSPTLQSAGRGLSIPDGAGLQAPAGAERLSVRVRSVRIDGAKGALATEAATLVSRLSGRTVTASEIFAAARALEQAYGAAGYALVRVLLPAQKLVDGGDVRFVVVDGFIERVDTNALPPEIRGRIAATLADIVGLRGLSVRTIERRLLIAGDMPGTVLRSTLAPGSGPGASVLVVEARYKPVTGSVAVDNTLAEALGTYTTSFGLDLNSPTGNGELLYLRAAGAPDLGGRSGFFAQEPRNRALAGGLVLPLGYDGLTLKLEATDARTAPRAEPGAPGFDSDFSRYSARVGYPLIRGRDFTLDADVTFDAQEDRLNASSPVTAPISLDRLRVARTGGDFSWFTPSLGLYGDGLLTGRVVSSFGIDGLGAREPPPDGSGLAPLSRQGARPDFQKLETTLAFTQPLVEHVTFDVKVRGQTSFNQPLPSSEQIGLASLTGLSTFDAGLFQGDEGYVVRTELQAPFVMPVSLPFALPSLPAQRGTGLPEGDTTQAALAIAPYGFGAFGMTRQALPTALEHAMVRGAAYGIGLRIGAAPQASFSQFNVSIEYGRGERSDQRGEDDRVTGAATLEF